jgi:AcrR family transcriptional regulator
MRFGGMSERAQARRAPPGRTSVRGEPVVRRVLEATVEELGRVGYGALRIEEVAARASINKSSVYRRWPTKEALVRAALLSIAECYDNPDPPSTGSIRDDLLAAAQRGIRFSNSPEGRMLIKVLAAERPDSELSIIARSIRETHGFGARMLLERAVERGELRPEVDLALFVEVLKATFNGALLSGQGIHERYVARVVDLLLTGALTTQARARERDAATRARTVDHAPRRDDA